VHWACGGRCSTSTGGPSHLGRRAMRSSAARSARNSGGRCGATEGSTSCCVGTRSRWLPEANRCAGCWCRGLRRGNASRLGRRSPCRFFPAWRRWPARTTRGSDAKGPPRCPIPKRRGAQTTDAPFTVEDGIPVRTHFLLSGLLLTLNLAASDESRAKQTRNLRQISKGSHQKATGEEVRPRIIVYRPN
jgi:hypothetical protein